MINEYYNNFIGIRDNIKPFHCYYTSQRQRNNNENIKVSFANVQVMKNETFVYDT